MVQARPSAIGGVLSAICRRLDPWQGRPRRSSSEAGVTLTYRFESEIPPVRPLRLKIEINTREHLAVRAYQAFSLSVENPWFTGRTDVTTFTLDELMGTKLRALYQRRKGRDLFDLWLCLSRALIDPEQVATCFAAYMKHQGRTISRAEFERNLFDKRNNPAFLSDIKPLLVAGVDYDANVALALVRAKLISRLIGEPWRGASSSAGADKRRKPKSDTRRRK